MSPPRVEPLFLGPTPVWKQDLDFPALDIEWPPHLDQADTASCVVRIALPKPAEYIRLELAP